MHANPRRNSHIYNYSINVLSMCSNIISHRSSKVNTSNIEGRHFNHRRSTHRSSMVDTSIIEGRHIDLQRSTHRSLKVDTSIFKGQHIDHRSLKVDTSISGGRHIDLQKLTHRSSKVDTSIFEDRRRKHRTDNPTLYRQFVTKYCPQQRSIVLYPKIPYGIISDEVTLTHTILYGNSNNTHDPTRALVLYYTPIYIAPNYIAYMR